METVQKIMHGHFKVMQGQKIQTKQNKTKAGRLNGRRTNLRETFPFTHAHLATWNRGSGELHGPEVGVFPPPPPRTTEI